MTDKEIIKALEVIEPTEFEKIPSVIMEFETAKEILDLINHKQAEIERLELVLLGVMHSVDKWLDGKELEQDEVNRAATMREKTLQIVERKQSEIDRQKSMNQAKLDTIHDLRAEIEVLNKTIDNYVSCLESIEKIKAKAYKEFAERLCDDRVSNDPVVIAVKTELKLTEVKDDE